MARKSKARAEFGDFQTPDALARAVLSAVQKFGFSPETVIEPSCGCGSFLQAAADAYPAARLIGLDINAAYLAAARARLTDHPNLTLVEGSFFNHDWSSELAGLAAPVLILGNPPWVTNAELGLLGSDNLPVKSNFQNMTGYDALTGKSNFDISEWMLQENLAWLAKKPGALAVLCKIAVARKVLRFAWKHRIPTTRARIHRIDALAYFGAAVEACLLIVELDGKSGRTECDVFDDLESAGPSSEFGFVDHALVGDLTSYRSYRELRAHADGNYRWRSGLKHDCARVMELERTQDGWENGLGEIVKLEDDYLFPLVKSADIGGVRHRGREKFVIVPQRVVGEDTTPIARNAPLTWTYLNRHRSALEARTSVIYRDKPSFSVFGVGPYTFAPWKIAISGLYKTLTFRLYGPRNGKAVIFDDTVYFLPFEERREAETVLELLNSDPAQAFLAAMIFWDDKRPITVDLLKRLDLTKLAARLGRNLESSAGAWDRTAPGLPHPA
jgi:hypothetical protein